MLKNPSDELLGFLVSNKVYGFDVGDVDFSDAHVLTDDFAPVEYYANDLM